uniref:Uncharacterized protein n=1 Tax=Solanum tuberosum TaxID=4113 RepID=M1CSL7_SOLTU
MGGVCKEVCMKQKKCCFHDQRKKVAYVVLSCTSTFPCKMKLLPSSVQIMYELATTRSKV